MQCQCQYQYMKHKKEIRNWKIWKIEHPLKQGITTFQSFIFPLHVYIFYQPIKMLNSDKKNSKFLFIYNSLTAPKQEFHNWGFPPLHSSPHNVAAWGLTWTKIPWAHKNLFFNHQIYTCIYKYINPINLWPVPTEGKIGTNRFNDANIFAVKRSHCLTK